MRAMDVRIMEIMGAMMIAMIKSRMRMRANIPKKNMRKMLNTARMVKIERKKALVVVPMMMPGHATLPTPRMNDEGKVIILYYIRSMRSMSLRLVKIRILTLVLIFTLVEVACMATLAQVKVIRGKRECATLKSKDTISYTSQGTSVINGGTHVPAKEPTIKGVMDALTGCSNIQGKEDLSCGHQGTIAKLNNFAITNEQSVTVSLSLSDPIDSLPHIDNVLVESVDTLVDPIDDRIDSSSNIDLYPPSVDIYEPQFGGTNKNVDHLIRSDSLCMSFVADPIACFAHRDHVLEGASKDDMCLFEGELACFTSSLVVDHSLFKYNILFDDNEITPSDVPSGVNHESSIVLDSYTCYNNPYGVKLFLPKDGNLFLEDESTLVGKECDEEEGGVCLPIPFSSWCVTIVNGQLGRRVGPHFGEDTGNFGVLSPGRQIRSAHRRTST
uniref:Uncharacterized protein n=1 Tax=Solanum tuberosum TaxID=4113 RepID=M1DPF6_SOLTU